MTHQRVIEVWKQVEVSLCSTVDPLNELFSIIYKGRYGKEYMDIIGKLLSVQEDLALIEMRETAERGDA